MIAFPSALLPDFALFIIQSQFDKWVSDRRKIIWETCQSTHYCNTLLDTITAPDFLVKQLQFLADGDIEAYLDSAKCCFLKKIFHDSYKEEFKGLVVRLGSIERQCFYNQLFNFSNDSNEIKSLLREIDGLSVLYELMMCDLKADQLAEDLHRQYFINERITHTIPGLITIFDITTGEDIYSNNKVESILGYNTEDRNRMKNNLLESIFHPEDLPRAYKDISTYIQIDENEIRSSEYRILHKNGYYLWFRYYVGVFKTNKDHAPQQIITLALNIQSEKEAHDKIKRNERLLLEAQSIAKMGNWVYCLDLRQFYGSKELYKIYGFDPLNDKVSFRSLLVPMSSKDRKSFLLAIRRTLEEKAPMNHYCQVLLPGGKNKMLHFNAEILYNEAEKTSSLVGTCQDVTIQKFAEEQLNEKNRFIQKITDATPAIISVHNIHTGRFIFINEIFERMLGYSKEDLLKEGVSFIYRLVHFNDREKVLEQFYLLTVKDDIQECRFRLKYIDGSFKELLMYSVVFDRNPDGKVEHILNVIFDITEQVEAEEKIREQQYFIQYIADASPAMLCLLDFRTGMIKYLNMEVYNSLGYLPDEIMCMDQKSLRLLVHPDDLDHIRYSRQKFNSRIENNKVVRYECRVRNKAGHWRWILFHEVVFKRNKAGHPVEVLISALDISQRKTAEQDLREKNIQLQQSNRLLEEFAYIASHDLQEPLRKMSLFGDLLLKLINENIQPDAYRALQKILSSGTQMQNLVRDVMSISQISFDQNFVMHNLYDLLNEAIAELNHKIQEVQAYIECHPLPVALIIPGQIRQLFINLLGNSLKYIRQGVRPVISVSSSFVKPGEVRHLELKEARQYLKIVFSDNGIGFENEFAEKIFVIFQRLHPKTAYAGTGIGLAICRKVVQNHGGAIKALGIPGEGAEFTIYLPV